MIFKISFNDVKSVGYTQEKQKEIVTIRLLEGNKSISFYADSQHSTKKWSKYCSLLFEIPKYAIPEIPIALQRPGISQYADLHKCDTGTYIHA